MAKAQDGPSDPRTHHVEDSNLTQERVRLVLEAIDSALKPGCWPESALKHLTVLQRWAQPAEEELDVEMARLAGGQPLNAMNVQ